MSMLIKRIILALPLALGWMIYTAQPTAGNLLLGYALSVMVLMATGIRGEHFHLQSAPRQLYNLLAYIVFLAGEVLLAGLQVAWITLKPSLPIDPGLSSIKTQDPSRSALISAISAHGITITPGELVVDFDESDADAVLMIVHSLNISASSERLDADQSKRLRRIKGILGYD